MRFPSGKTHYPSRRHLGRGQYPAAEAVTVTVTASGSTATITYSRPVVVTGTVPLTVVGTTVVSQAVVSPTVVQQLFAAPLTNQSWAYTAGTIGASTYQGGPIRGAIGYFGPPPPSGSLILSITVISPTVYDVQWNSNATANTPGIGPTSLAFYSPTTSSWQPGSATSRPAADTVRHTIATSVVNCTHATLPLATFLFILAVPPLVPQTFVI